VRSLEGDHAAGELEEGEVVLVLLGPADQDPPVAVEPWVTGLDDPPSRSPVRVAPLEVDLLAASADVWRELAVFEQFADDGEVVALVQAETLGVGLGWFWTLDRDRVERLLQQLVVVAVRAVVSEPDRDTTRLDEERTLRPPLALSVGLGPVFGPPSGALLIAPSAASQDQSIPTCAS
jgi:hypothetical protein